MRTALAFALCLGIVTTTCLAQSQTVAGDSARGAKTLTQFVYVSGSRSDGSGVISGFRIGTNGALRAIPGTGYVLPEPADLLATDPSGRFLFAVTKSAILTLRVNASTGKLRAVSATPLSPDAIRTGIVVDPVARFLLLSNDLNPPQPGNESPFGPPQVTTYRIGVHGQLALVGSTQVPDMAGSIINGLSVDSAGKLIGLNTINSNDVFTTTALKLNSSTGEVTFLNTLFEPFEDFTRQLLIDPAGTHFYQNLSFQFESPAGASIAVYTVDASAGVQEKVQVQSCGCDPNAGLGQFSFGFNLAIDPKGRFLFQSTTAGLVVYSIDQSTGLVTPLPSLFPMSPDAASALAVDATGTYVYFVDNGLKGVRVSSSGETSLIPGTPILLPAVNSNLSVVVLSLQPR